jgi:MFS family permease
MGTLFLILTAMCAIGAVMVAYLPVVQVQHHAEPPPPSHWGDVRRALLAGVASRAFAGGFAFGMYLTVWPIFLTRHGASDWDVALTWTLFAVPAVIFGPWAGRLIDRYGPGTSAVLGAFFSAIVVGTYALAGHVPLILALCMLEGIGFAFAYPAQNTLTVHTAPDDMRGRVIGLVTAVKTGGTLLGALATPVLYTISPITAFGTTSLVLMAGAVALGIGMWADHRRHPPVPPSPPAAAPRESAPTA